MTPPPSSKRAPHRANETITEKQPEALEAPKNGQEETPRPTAVPRREGEETKASVSSGTRLHHHGPPGIMSGQEQGPPHKLDPKEKIHRTAPRRKRTHIIVLSNPETYVNPKALKETHAPALLEPPPPRPGGDRRIQHQREDPERRGACQEGHGKREPRKC